MADQPLPPPSPLGQPPKGTSVTLCLLVAGVALSVLGSAITLLLPRSKPADDGQLTANNARATQVVQPSGPLAWRLFAPQGDGYEVSIPGEPEVRPTPEGNHLGTKYRVSVYGGKLYFVTASYDLPEVGAKPADLADRVSEQRQLFEAIGGRVFASRDILLGRTAGHEFQMESPDGREGGIVRLYLTSLAKGARLFLVIMGGLKDHLRRPECTRFLESFRITVD